MMYRVLQGDCLAVLPTLDADSIDAVVTDPPAGISFMGRTWDGDHGGRNLWIAHMQQIAAEVLRVCKPGAHALVWALPRTSHWTATAWENAGWTVKDRVSHLFGTGFPKSHDVSKGIDKAAGATRKIIGTQKLMGKARVLTGGNYTGNYDERVLRDSVNITAPATAKAHQWEGWGTALKPACEDWWLFRKPLIGTVAANVLAHGTGALNIKASRVPNAAETGVPLYVPAEGRWPSNLTHDGSDEILTAFAVYGEQASGSLARFFYCAKISKAERAGNKHPTAKSLALMRYLCTLITPTGGTILDPFAGSGTTLQAAKELGFNAIGIELDTDYVKTCRQRLRTTRLRTHCK